MTHDAFRRRLEALEEAHRLAAGPTQIINIFFRDPKSPVIATMARNSLPAALGRA
jgi:hypothetical protein